MDFHLQVNKSNPEHVHCTLFANGANCGQLTLTPEEYSAFGRVLLLGGGQLVEPFVGIQVDTMIMPKERR